MTKHKKSPRTKTAKYSDKEFDHASDQQRNRAGHNNSRLKPSGSGFGPNGQTWLYGIHVVEAALANLKRKKYRLLVNKEWTTSYKVDGNEILFLNLKGLIKKVINLCPVHVIWTECRMMNLVLNVCFDFFSRHKNQI